MTDRDFNRDRQRRYAENENDWDWDYYYEYRYIPYSPYRRTDYDRYNYARDYDRSPYYERGNYNRDYDDNSGMYPYGRSSYGRYSGVGPRGYQRSDERIMDDINDRLTWHGDIDASDIQVDVNDGIVTLTGTVEDRHQKRMAEYVAESVSGVQDVNNQLHIRNRSWGGENRMSGMNRQIRPGMEVIGRDGNHIGEVKELRSNNFLVDRPMARDVYIPFSACQISGGQIRLNVRADEVDDQGWEMPDLLETDTTQKSQKRR